MHAWLNVALTKVNHIYPVIISVLCINVVLIVMIINYKQKKEQNQQLYIYMYLLHIIQWNNLGLMD